jgi:hypothetical protein
MDACRRKISKFKYVRYLLCLPSRKPPLVVGAISRTRAAGCKIATSTERMPIEMNRRGRSLDGNSFRRSISLVNLEQ